MRQASRDTPGDPEGYLQRDKRTFVVRLAAGAAVAGAVALALLLTGQGEVLWQLFSDRGRI